MTDASSAEQAPEGEAHQEDNLVGYILERSMQNLAKLLLLAWLLAYALTSEFVRG